MKYTSDQCNKIVTQLLQLESLIQRVKLQTFLNIH